MPPVKYAYVQDVLGVDVSQCHDDLHKHLPDPVLREQLAVTVSDQLVKGTTSGVFLQPQIQEFAPELAMAVLA